MISIGRENSEMAQINIRIDDDLKNTAEIRIEWIVES